MVRAILDGSKTQTRRVVKKTDSGRVKAIGSARNWHLDDPNAVEACPYGKTGDRLWVKETHAINPEDGGIVYRATDPSWDEASTKDCKTILWKPSIFCRREYSRITLEIVSVRVERLNFINEQDCVAEGVSAYVENDRSFTAKEAYSLLWESINGAGSWDANPWVWVMEFKRVERSEA